VSFVAKVFVVLNLIMSAFFLMFAMYTWTAQTKWQKMYEVEKARKVEEYARLQKNEVALAQAVVKAEQAVAAMRAQVAAERRSKEEERDKNLTLQAELTTERNAKALAEAGSQEVTREKDRIAAELLKSRSVILKLEQAVTVERDNSSKYKNEKADMEVDLNQTKSQLAQTSRDLHKVEQNLQEQNNRMETAIRNGVALESFGPTDVNQPAIEAKVLAVRPDVGLVMLSVGSQQNVKPGYRFTVSKGSEYIGKVQVDKVYADMSSAKILPDLSNKGAVFEQNDDARTR
jgi:septal ring factor EnvC (AmiA/AmiB activator)